MTRTTLLHGVYISGKNGSSARFLSVKAPALVELTQLIDSITYRIAVGPQQGRKVFTLHILPYCESDNPSPAVVGKTAGFSLHAGVATRSNEREELERLCRYIARPAISTKRLSLTRNGQLRYELKTPRRNGTRQDRLQPQS